MRIGQRGLTQARLIAALRGRERESLQRAGEVRAIR